MSAYAQPTHLIFGTVEDWQSIEKAYEFCADRYIKFKKSGAYRGSSYFQENYKKC